MEKSLSVCWLAVLLERSDWLADPRVLPPEVLRFVDEAVGWRCSRKYCGSYFAIMLWRAAVRKGRKR
jgi:hypothetical protein